MWREIGLRESDGGFSQWRRDGDAGDAWVDVDNLLAECREGIAAMGGGEVVELVDGAELPAGIVDVRGRIEREPDRVFGWLDVEGVGHYFGLEEAAPRNLDELAEMMRRHDPAAMDRSGEQWSADLPVFGSPDLVNPEGVWSWDDSRAIVASCADDLKIVSYRVEGGKMLLGEGR